MKGPVTSHILDVSLGRPAQGVPVKLMKRSSQGSFEAVGEGVTNSDGRVSGLVEAGAFHPGIYSIFFDTGAYFAARGGESFYPEVTIVFEVKATTEHYHVPLLLSPFGYSTYRGS
jgi:5-hydroxyisourate hydrolase